MDYKLKTLDLCIWLGRNLLQGEKDDKIIAVCADDPEFRHYKDIKELPPHRLAEIRRFFEDCIHSLVFIILSYSLIDYLSQHSAQRSAPLSICISCIALASTDNLRVALQ